MKNILWVTTNQISNQNGVLSSLWASTRYRVIIPSHFLALRHYKHLYLLAQKKISSDELNCFHDKQAVIFSKSSRYSNEQRAAYAKQQGIKVILDVCDNYFDTEKVAGQTAHYKKMVALADIVTVSTAELAAIVETHTGKQAIVIPDPYEYPQQPASFQPSSKQLNLLWFGSHKNVDSLKAMIPQLTPLSHEIPLKLHIITTPQHGLEGACERFNTQSENYQLQFSPWSLEITQKAMQKTDFIMIPSLSIDVKMVKSPNRLIESVHSGRFVIAYPLPSYQEFAQWAWVNDHFVEGIRWALQHPQQVIDKIQAAQHYITQHYSPERAGLLWEQVIKN
ncbi:hypothetical protein [Candidatus Albibeggiatoa sp. nov. BB20]|uniref:glycosyltransferase n=1 Tax=Candidatus Albibeggiatoa sp. nov. BB20 TaxID=3162723 RepID=UPI003365413F